MFFKSSVIRDNLLVSSKAHEWRRTLDELQGNNTITTRQEAMTGTQASAISGATTGFLVACVLCESREMLNMLASIAQNSNKMFYLVTVFFIVMVDWLHYIRHNVRSYSGMATLCVWKGKLPLADEIHKLAGKIIVTGSPPLSMILSMIVRCMSWLDQKIKFSWEINVRVTSLS